MTREEYELRKKRLEEEHREAVDLIGAAYRQQLRALELVWVMTSGDAAQLPSLLTGEPKASAPPKPIPPPPEPPPRRRDAWELLDEVHAALDQVPDLFNRNDLCRALGYRPDRGSLHRTLRDVIDEGLIAEVSEGMGRTPAIYRKTAAPAPQATG